MTTIRFQPFPPIRPQISYQTFGDKQVENKQKAKFLTSNRRLKLGKLLIKQLAKLVHKNPKTQN